ncbi:MAG: Crp/Fnr family transcriptional regulator [Hyphomicrobiaceae bacterium]
MRRALIEKSRRVRLTAGDVIFGPGTPPENLLLLVAGTLRVQQASESGREIVLYRVSAGESCVLTTACLLAYEGYLAEGIAETDIDAVAVPRATFEELIARSPEFRRFVFRAFSARVTELFRIIDEVAFAKIDIRLAQRLIVLADRQQQITLTHQELASELGTTREVVSRQLAEFQRRGWISQQRGRLSITDRDALERFAHTT